MKFLMLIFLCLFKISIGDMLPVPPILEEKDGVFNLEVVERKYKFFDGVEESTLGYNGNILGPTIRVKKGEMVEINVKNSLSEETTVHWHGLRVIGIMDGGPHQVIKPKTTWRVRFPIEQEAATLWYHPHLLHKTGIQVYKGLAGLFIIDDERSESINLPKEYGIDDIPLIIQDKRFDSQKQLEYLTKNEDIINGMLGNVGMVNGVIEPIFKPKLGVTRFRILNGANARTFNLSFSDNRTFYIIATDGGLLEKPIRRKRLLLGPGERVEILVNFKSLNKNVKLKDEDHTLLTFIPEDKKGQVGKIPKTLNEKVKLPDTSKLKRRYFVMQGSGRNVNINGKQMDMDRIDEYIKLNDPEIWVVTNDSHHMGRGMMSMMGNIPHPFHIHNTQFRILKRDGRPPYKWEQGNKDTVLVDPGETVELFVEFRHTGLFMYHCHILEHEDMGMMGQFDVSK